MITAVTDPVKASHSEKLLLGSKIASGQAELGTAPTKSTFQGKAIFVSDSEKTPALSAKNKPISNESFGHIANPTKDDISLKNEKIESPKGPLIPDIKEDIKINPMKRDRTESAIKQPPASEHKDEPKLPQKISIQSPPLTAGSKHIAHLKHGEIDSFDKDLDISADKITLKQPFSSPSEESQSQKEPQKETVKENISSKPPKEEKRRQSQQHTSEDHPPVQIKESNKELIPPVLQKDTSKEIKKEQISPTTTPQQSQSPVFLKVFMKKRYFHNLFYKIN